MNKYKLLGFKRGKEIKATILINATGKTFTAPVKYISQSEIIENLSHFECREIYRKLYSSEKSSSYYEVTERDEKNWFTYFYLSLFFSILLITSNTIGIKPIEAFGLIVPSAIFIFPFTYVISDMLNEFYGLRFARKTINAAFLNNIIFCTLIYLCSLAKPLPQWPFDNDFSNIASEIVSVLFASSFSYLVAEHLNAFLLYKIRLLTDAKNLFLRVTTSTIISSFVDSVIFIYIAFYYLEHKTIWLMIGGQLAIKTSLAVLGVFPIYFFRNLFIRKISC